MDDRAAVTACFSRVKVSMSKREPAPPVKVRKTGPVGVPVSAVETVRKFSQPPVFGTASEPSTGPVADPERTWTVPPEPPEEIFAVNVLVPVREACE